MKSKARNGIISCMMDTFCITSEEAGLRLDKLLTSRFPLHSRTYFHYLIERGCVLVNGNPLKKREKVKAGDEIDVCFLLTEEISLEPEAIPLDILYEDDALIAINKPVGMVVHPAPGHPRGTFVNALLHHCNALAGTDPLRPGIVHRLDKDTTGVLIAAKTATAHSRLVAAFSERAIKKTYIAICVGVPKEGLIDAPIARHPILRQQMAVCPEKGREAKTRLRILSKDPDLACVELELITGRTHQIRVHLQYLGTPILGDSIYGFLHANKKFQAKRQLLHAASIQLLHPMHGTPLEIQAPLPSDIYSFVYNSNLSYNAVK